MKNLRILAIATLAASLLLSTAPSHAEMSDKEFRQFMASFGCEHLVRTDGPGVLGVARVYAPRKEAEKCICAAIGNTKFRGGLQC